MTVSMGTVFDVLVLCACMEKTQYLDMLMLNVATDLAIENKGFTEKE